MDNLKSNIAFGFIIAGVLLSVLGYRNMKIDSVAKQKPQAMTCAELEENGPADNAHIVLTDFYVCDFSYVVEERNFKWERAFVPVLPKGSGAHLAIVRAMRDQSERVELPSDIRVILKLPDARSEADVEKTGRESALQGTVVNVLHSLDKETKKLLSDSYPGVDFAHVWILEVGLSPGAPGMKWLMFVGAGASFLISAGLYLSARREME